MSNLYQTGYEGQNTSNSQHAAAFGNITSANATAVLTVTGLFPGGITLQQFSTDQSVHMDDLVMAETRMGIDGHMAAGWIPTIKPVSVKLEASSPSYEPLAQIVGAQDQGRRLYECTLTVRLPAIGREYVWSGGVLKSGNVFPNARKVLEPTLWKFDFARFKQSGI